MPGKNYVQYNRSHFITTIMDTNKVLYHYSCSNFFQNTQMAFQINLPSKTTRQDVRGALYRQWMYMKMKYLGRCPMKKAVSKKEKKNLFFHGPIRA